MKLRFRGNSLRLRVNQREVQELAAGRAIEQQVPFPGGSCLLYRLESADTGSAAASFAQNTIRVAAPASDIRDWAAHDEIGLYFDLPAGEQTLRLLIEKDLECIDGPPEERDPDAFLRAPAKTC